MIMALVLASVHLLSGDGPPAPVAMVLTSKGGVTLVRGKEAPLPAGPMTLLQPGDLLAAPADGEAVIIFLAEGQRERLKPKTLTSVGPKGCEPAEAVEPVKGPKLPPPNLASLRDLATSSRGAVGVARGESPPKPQVITPLYGTVILTDRPELSWPAVKADAYLVEFFTGAEGKDERRLWTATVKGTNLPYPDKEKPLDLSKKYRWRVTPMKGEDASADPIVESKFLVVTKSEKELLSKVKKLEDSKDPADLLVVALSYEAHGVYGEALRLYERLAVLSPGEANFQRALASYYERAGRKDLAEKAREKAKKLGAKAAGK